MQTRLSSEERQAEIVAAALQLARDRSPAQITTHDIAAAVAVTQGAVFKHFDTKDAIWLAAMRRVRETLLQQLQAAAAQATTPLDALAAMFRAHVDFVAAHPGVPRVIFHELQQSADTPVRLEVRALLQGYRRLLLEVLAQAAAQRQLRGGLDAEAAATAFIGLIQGLVMQSMLAGRPGAVRQQAERVFALFRHGIEGAP